MSAKQKDTDIIDSTEGHTLPANAGGQMSVRDFIRRPAPAHALFDDYDPDTDSTEGYTLPVNARGQMPVRDFLRIPSLDAQTASFHHNLKTHRAGGKILAHARFGHYDPDTDSVTLRIDSEAYPEFWLEVDLKRKEMEAALPPASEPPKKKKQKHVGLSTKEWRGVVDEVHRPSLEGQYIKWEEWDARTDMATFTNCEFLTDLDVFKKGDKVSEVELCMESSVMRVYKQDPNEGECEGPHVDFSAHLVLQRMD